MQNAEPVVDLLVAISFAKSASEYRASSTPDFDARNSIPMFAVLIRLTVVKIEFGNVYDVDFGDNFDDDIEEIAGIDNRVVHRKPYTIYARENHFDKWDDREFFKRFRLTKQSVQYLLRQTEHRIRYRTERNNAVSPMCQLLMALRFYATGHMLISVDAIARLRPAWIKFPTTEEGMAEIKEGFYRMARFPRVLGCVDCTHVRMLSPAIAGPKFQVQNIVARWPGSAHDSNIFSHSTINARFESGEFGDSLLLRDSGYAVTNFMMTPLPATHNLAEELYNESQIRTRNSVERLFEVIKRRFPVLSIGMRVAIPKVQNFIVASFVLHNIAIHYKEDEPPVDPDVRIPNLEQPEVLDELFRMENARQQLIENYFVP
ncbi:putative nuclease HARBI1 [Belonocnema kinseyi]|uniref:putative nuclease HARBI1 n=1 Tax=Belonocnema kinseyi TaxID=2817044 RepID=UPI00143DE526|nr:putative nuclease HARBI1 [Belonocnema kinseyi]